jgi:hypothetical protein
MHEDVSTITQAVLCLTAEIAQWVMHPKLQDSSSEKLLMQLPIPITDCMQPSVPAETMKTR